MYVCTSVSLRADECPPGWSRFNSSCYRGFSSPDRILSYTEAQVTRGREVASLTPASPLPAGAVSRGPGRQPAAQRPQPRGD